jgi:hypothetical protein
VLDIFFVIIELMVLVGATFWEQLKVFDTEAKAFQWFVISQFALLFAYLIAKSKSDKKTITEAISGFRSQIDVLSGQFTNNIAPLRQEDFYNEFREAIRRAQFSVDISHLDIKPPDHAATPRSATKNYYEEFAKLLKEKTSVRFRRVERVSPEKRDWLEKLTAAMDGKRNCSLGCLGFNDDRRKLATVSAQIVDSEKAYLVALIEHTESHSPRDIRIQGGDVAKMWRDYYEQMLWSPSLKIVEDGTVNKVALTQLMAELDRLEKVDNRAAS